MSLDAAICAQRPLPSAAVSLALAVTIAALCWRMYTSDMAAFLLPWFAHIREAGPIEAFASPFSNYTPMYLYLLAAASPLAAIAPDTTVIKLVSLLGLLALTASIRRLLIALRHPQAWPAAALIGLAPTLVVNATVLTQCDAYWAALLVMAMTAAVDRRHAAMFAWCGLAIAFKAQAAFVAPFFLALALSRRIPFRLWLAAPAAVVAAMLPAILAGWPPADLLTIYLRQTQWETGAPLNAPNIWTIVESLGGLNSAMFATTATLLAITAAVAYSGLFARLLRAADPVTLVRAALLCTLIVPGLLPRMHERYFFLADVLALVLVAIRPREWQPAVLTQLGSGLAILAYLSNIETLAGLGGLAMILATGLVARSLLTMRGLSPKSRPMMA